MTMEGIVKDTAAFAVAHYGKQHQKQKAVEEIGELLAELMREDDGRTSDARIVSEIADVMFMMEQLAVIYGQDAVADELRRKKRRTVRRIIHGI